MTPMNARILPARMLPGTGRTAQCLALAIAICGENAC